MKPIEYLGTIFFDLMRIQPRETFYSTSLFLAKSIIELDKKDKERKQEDTSTNDAHLRKLKYIKESTHEDLKMPLAIAEAIVASTERDKWGKEFEGKNNLDKRITIKGGKSIRVLDIYRLLKEAYSPMIDAVVDVIKDYSMEYRMSPSENDNVPTWLGGKEDG